jgi:probable rRNA maturation factor
MPVLMNDLTGGKLSVQVLPVMEKIAATALEKAGISLAAEISLLLCDDKMIQELNKSWRSEDKPTDVLSFPLLDEEEPDITAEELLLGDIVISLDSAARQAMEYGWNTEEEVLRLFTHGLLHLLGYDHKNQKEEQEMRSAEEKLLHMAGVRLDAPHEEK